MAASETASSASTESFSNAEASRYAFSSVLSKTVEAFPPRICRFRRARRADGHDASSLSGSCPQDASAYLKGSIVAESPVAKHMRCPCHDGQMPRRAALLRGEPILPAVAAALSSRSAVAHAAGSGVPKTGHITGPASYLRARTQKSVIRWPGPGISPGTGHSGGGLPLRPREGAAQAVVLVLVPVDRAYPCRSPASGSAGSGNSACLFDLEPCAQLSCSLDGLLDAEGVHRRKGKAFAEVPVAPSASVRMLRAACPPAARALPPARRPPTCASRH